MSSFAGLLILCCSITRRPCWFRSGKKKKKKTKVFILQLITVSLVMVLFFHVPSTKDKTYYKDIGLACNLNSMMCSDHSLSMLERWGTHRWGVRVRDLCCLLKPTYWSRELQSSAQLEESMEEILHRSWILTETAVDIWKVQ